MAPEGNQMAKTQIGKRLYISTTLPATNDAAGFEALTWTLVEGRQQLFQLGITHATIEIEDLDGFNGAAKGAGQGTESTGMFYDVFSSSARDEGQEDLITAAESADGTIAVKQVKGTGTGNAPATGDPVEYAQGFAHSYVPMQPTVSTYEGFNVTFRQTERTVRAPHPTVT